MKDTFTNNRFLFAFLCTLQNNLHLSECYLLNPTRTIA